jgi:hypothetical protein
MPSHVALCRRPLPAAAVVGDNSKIPCGAIGTSFLGQVVVGSDHDLCRGLGSLYKCINTLQP